MPIEPRIAAPRAGEADETSGPGEATDGDSALILWMLSLDVTRRLEVAQGFVESVEALRSGRPY
jgi:hypothetical protein